jgi:N-acetyl-gamma-glutamyl-phosphate reductase
MTRNKAHSNIQVGIIGGTGYTGAELLRLLHTHPSVSVSCITSRAEAGRAVQDFFPSLRGAYRDLRFQEPEVGIFGACDVVFSATPNGVAMQHAPEILKTGAVFIDLAADFRLRDPAEWEKWYQIKHACPELLSDAVYGLPELFATTIASNRLIANPGCYPTATILGLAPLLSNKLIHPGNIIVDAKSGVTGAGRGANVATLFSEVSDSFKAYGASGHRHHPEIQQVLQSLHGAKNPQIGLTFIPHLVPMLRGIHSSIYVDQIDIDKPLEFIHETFRQFYQDKPFVDVLSLGDHPETRSVKGSNICRIGIHRATGSNKLVVFSVIDNLVKGAAGQAVQNMNIALGIDETMGLMSPPMVP